MDRAEKIKFVQSIQDGWKNGTVPEEEAIQILSQFANEHAINNDANFLVIFQLVSCVTKQLRYKLVVECFRMLDKIKVCDR